jgi:hypothetical protein
MLPTIALLPSPLLGPVVWEPVAAVLREQRWSTFVADLPSEIITSQDVLDAVGSQLPRKDLVLVPHSNIGLFVPALAELVRPVATVFVDAALPGPGAATTLAPPRFLEFLTGLADHQGRLPPWVEWWEDEELHGLFPDAAWRRRVEAAGRRLPLTYFTSTVRVPAGWADHPCAYLGFAGTYADEQSQARNRGWPVQVIDGGHLHMLHAPEAVVDGIVELLGRLGVT